MRRRGDGSCGQAVPAAGKRCRRRAGRWYETRNSPSSGEGTRENAFYYYYYYYIRRRRTTPTLYYYYIMVRRPRAAVGLSFPLFPSARSVVLLRVRRIPWPPPASYPPSRRLRCHSRTTASRFAAAAAANPPVPSTVAAAYGRRRRRIRSFAFRSSRRRHPTIWAVDSDSGGPPPSPSVSITSRPRRLSRYAFFSHFFFFFTFYFINFLFYFLQVSRLGYTRNIHVIFFSLRPRAGPRFYISS